MILINVDLPAPLSPTSATTSPARMSRLKFSIATTPPKCFWMPCSDRTAGDVSCDVSVMASSQRPIGRTAEGVVDGLDHCLAPGQAGHAHDIGPRDEGLRPEAE